MMQLDKEWDKSNGLSKNNVFLTVAPDVVLNEALDKVISRCDIFFAKANHKATVTSGIRTPQKQLEIIFHYLDKKGIKDDYILHSDINTRLLYEGHEIFTWQLAWSKLLNAGVIINPPLRAMVLLDYTNRRGENMKGQYMNPSVHFLGKAFDIGGGGDGIENELAILKEAKSNIPQILDFVVERSNNCLHIDIT